MAHKNKITISALQLKIITDFREVNLTTFDVKKKTIRFYNYQFFGRTKKRQLRKEKRNTHMQSEGVS